MSTLSDLLIRSTEDADLPHILEVERDAFGEDEEAELVRQLLDDPTARPLLSLLAWRGERPAGHILITHADLETETGDEMPAVRGSILAPLAVVPGCQRSGVGGALVRDAIRRTAAAGVDLMFVLGHPSYYPRHGFTPAGRQGFEAPFPIALEDADAWMVQELRSGFIGRVRGRVIPAETFRRPEYWRE